VEGLKTVDVADPSEVGLLKIFNFYFIFMVD
jgi:hypothetical protein